VAIGGIGSSNHSFGASSYTPPQRVAPSPKYGGDGSDHALRASARSDTTRQASLKEPLALTNDKLQWKSVTSIAPWT
jgi:hypothetical protein